MHFNDRRFACIRELTVLILGALGSSAAGSGDTLTLTRAPVPELPELLQLAELRPLECPRNGDRAPAGHLYRPGAVPASAGQLGGRTWLAARAARPPPGKPAADIPAARIAAAARSIRSPPAASASRL